MTSIKRLLTNYSSEFIVLLAVLVGAFLRTWRVGDIPFPPNDSELFFAYYGHSLLKHGIDEFGTSWPSNFPSIGDFKYPGLAYLTMLPALFFGLTIITVKFWTVLSGVLLIPVLYLFALLIFKNRSIAALSAWFVALSPWSIVLSRVGYENHPAMFFVLCGFTLLLLCFVKLDGISPLYAKLSTYIDSHRRPFLLAAFIFLVVAIFTYAAVRVFVPLMLLVLFTYSRFKESKLTASSKTLFVFFIVLSTLTVVLLIPWQNRGRLTAIGYSKLQPEEAQRQEISIVESGVSPVTMPVIVTRLLHNKYRIMLYHYISKYGAHFSPGFLFFEGDEGYERIPDTGQLLLIEMLLMPLGLLLLFARRKGYGLILLFWLLAAPIASTLTIGSKINRASLMIPALAMLSGAGFYYIISLKSKFALVFKVGLFVALFFSSSFALYQIFVIKPVHQAWYSEVVNEEMVDYVLGVKDDYEAVAISRDEYIYFLFYGKIDPVAFLADSDIRQLAQDNPWNRVERFSNIYFNMAYDCPKGGKLNVLYVCRGENVPQNANVVKAISYRDGVAAYTFVTFYPISQMPATLPILPSGLKYMVDLESIKGREDGIITADEKNLW